MTGLFQNKYRIPSARLQSWDYNSAGMYFITICTGGRECYFGQIVETPCMASLLPVQEPSQTQIEPCLEMQLSEIGKLAANEWAKTIELRPDMNLELGEYVIMPNHMHGIIIIGENQYNAGERRVDDSHRDAMHGVSTNGKFGPQTKNIGSIIRGYKSAVTTWARKNNVEFGWQSRFYDHIIGSALEYERISNYIISNVANWKGDKFNKDRSR